MSERAGKTSRAQELEPNAPSSHTVAPGKHTLVEQVYTAGVQRRANAAADTSTVHAAAAQGIATPSSPLPHADIIQRSFGHHDISSVQAHTGADAAASAGAMGAEGYASGNHVVFAGAPSLHTAAHEAAHVVQQSAGVQLKGGVGAEGDSYERHADAVADTVTRGESAQGLLDQVAGAPHSGAGQGAVQRKLSGSMATLTLEGFKAQLATHNIKLSFREVRTLFDQAKQHDREFGSIEEVIEALGLQGGNPAAKSSSTAELAPEPSSVSTGKPKPPRPPAKPLSLRTGAPQSREATESVRHEATSKPAPETAPSVSSGVVKAVETESESAPETASPSGVPAEAAAVIARFNSTGVFVSTIQSQSGVGMFKKPKNDLVKFFKNAVGPDQGVESGKVKTSTLRPEQMGHPTNNWSLAHKDLVANYYQLVSEDGTGTPHTDWDTAKRSVATITDPTKIGDKFLSNSPSDLSFGKDASSSSTAGSLDGKPVYGQGEANTELARLLASEKAEQQKTPGKSAQNTEIKTLGFDPNAVVGFIALFVDKERPLLQEAVNQIQSTHDKFPVFTWSIEDGHTVLRYVETITRQAS